MFITAITLLLLSSPTPVDVSANRQIAAPCQVIEDRAILYLEEHDFYTKIKTQEPDLIIEIGSLKHILAPSGKPLSLNRFNIQKYTFHRHLSPLKSYADFHLEGHLRLAKATEESCNVSLHFDISAYEYVWFLGMIDDGYRSKFFSNGTLEHLYIDPISKSLTKDTH